jgi:purine-cytosine permease-like protein
MLGNLSATMYSVTLNFQMLLPWLFRIPRVVFAVITTAIVIPVAVEAAKKFFINLENFIGVIGYWSAAFIGVVLVEHLVMRKANMNCYTEDEEAWDDPKKLPPGFAAIAVAVICFGLVIPGMSQIWFTGPIAEKTGDIGLECALVVSALLYLPLRYLERKRFGR